MINYKDINWSTAGTAPGEKCNTLSCIGKATHVASSKSRAAWYCYYCAVKLNGRAKTKVCISAKEYTMKILMGEV